MREYHGQETRNIDMSLTGSRRHTQSIARQDALRDAMSKKLRDYSM